MLFLFIFLLSMNQIRSGRLSFDGGMMKSVYCNFKVYISYQIIRFLCQFVGTGPD